MNSIHINSDINQTVDALVIGGGHAGLSMSYCLTALNIQHVVLERGEIGNRWRKESWDSLRLLTPNFQINLPGCPYIGSDPEGFMSVTDFISLLEVYAKSFCAPVLTGITVDSVEKNNAMFSVRAGKNTWLARTVIIATGHCSVPFIPDVAKKISSKIIQLTASQYRNSNELPSGGVLVVGAGASGVQISEELINEGREVILSVGRHRRLPRRYRGRDILWWLDQMGIFHELSDPSTDREFPAPQLVGSEDGRSIDLGILQTKGVKLVGKLIESDGLAIFFDTNLKKDIDKANHELSELLKRIDEFAEANDPGGQLMRVQPIKPETISLHINLKQENINTIIWATGYCRKYPWLRLNTFDKNGELNHIRGIAKIPGLYIIGLRRQIRYNSNFIDGVGEDAALLADHLKNYLTLYDAPEPIHNSEIRRNDKGKKHFICGPNI